MRYQEPIYIQNENGAVRNKDILNVNMSSDMYVFECPQFSVSGASKIDCTGTTGTSYVVSTATTIPIVFEFTANTDTFTATNATFKYEIYKYSNVLQVFAMPAVYSSDIISYSAISGTSSVTQNLNVSNLGLDGEYLIKGYYNFNIPTKFLNKLGKKVDTRTYISGSEFGIYDHNQDYHFTAIKSAEEPILLQNSSNTPPSNTLLQQIILPIPGINTVVIANGIGGDFILTLNGLVLAYPYDYTVSGNMVTLNSKTVEDDIITIIYTTTGGINLMSDVINVITPVISGISGNEGSNTSYYNTTTGKYEVYTSTTPLEMNSIIVMINGVTLANGVDFYQSISNRKRIILEGNILVDDIITIAYFPLTSVINGLTINNPVVSWKIKEQPQLVNGLFTLEVSTANTFTNLYASDTTPYVVGLGTYSLGFTASGNIGSKLYYRIKNEKEYTKICGDNLVSTVYSEIIPLIIQTNAINSY